jgi:hypothetical protein
MKKHDKELQIINLTPFTNSKILNLDELKFLIDSSLISLFGMLEANKIKYSLKTDENLNFVLRTYDM